MDNARFYNKHLKENNMNYFQHMWFALMLAGKTFGCAIGSVIHAFLPFVLVTHTSRTIKKLNDTFLERNKKKEGSENAMYKAPQAIYENQIVRNQKQKVNTINY
jgi:hypothetical protein